jgi:hypothetical protein
MAFEWLNDDARLFLSRGYLEEGVTAEQRVRDIADAAEKRLGIIGFADKFYDYMSRGFYSLASSRILLNKSFRSMQKLVCRQRWVQVPVGIMVH